MRFTSSQTLAVEALTHTFRAEGASTMARLRGAPAAARGRWLDKDGRVNASDIHQLSLSNNLTQTLVTEPGVAGGMGWLAQAWIRIHYTNKCSICEQE